MKQNSFLTSNGLEPDKWASVWLIKRHVNPGATVKVLPARTALEDSEGILFDTPDAPYRRSRDKATFQSLLETVSTPDPILVTIGEIVYDIEVSSWMTPFRPETDLFEHSFRQLQQNFGRTEVPHDCYDAFFDEVYRALKTDNLQALPKWVASMQAGKEQCPPDSQTLVSAKRPVLIPEVPIREVLHRISTGKHVVFVDTRETAEYEEGHIPGAVNLKLRDIGTSITPQFEGADLVVSYCMKDFRAYEVAKSLQTVGVRNVAIMKPYGIKGWKAAGLPVTRTGALSDDEAFGRLRACLDAPSTCPNTGM